MNVSDQLLNIILSNGVKNVHEVAGDALNFLVKAIEENDNIHWRGFKHVGNASFAACRVSETTGNLAVCAGTVGPSALHHNWII